MRIITKAVFVLSLFVSFSILAQDSLNMTLLSTYDPGANNYNDVWGYTTATGEEYAIIGNATRIYVADVTDCENPVEVFSYVGGNSTTWRDFKTFGDYMYGVCDNCTEGLHIFNMSALPGGVVTHELSTTAFFPDAHNIYIDEGEEKLYAVGVPGATDAIVLDLSVTPEDPTLIENIDFGSGHYIHDIYVREDTAYVSHGYLGFKVWDVSDPSAVVELGFMDTGNYNHSAWTSADGKYAYYAEEVPKELPMGVIDLTAAQTGVGSLDTITTFQHRVPSSTSGQPTPHNPYVVGDTLFVSHYEDGVKMFDLTDPEDPVILGYYDTYTDNGTTYGGYNGCWGIYPFFESGCLMASDRKYGLNILKYEAPIPPLPDCDSITAYLTDPLMLFDFSVLASDTILINGTMGPQYNYYLEAENSVLLDKGFDARTGANFEAVIGPCETMVPIKPEEAVEIKKN